MKNLIPLLLLLAGYSATAQESDTTIYDFVDSMPFALLNSCSEEQHPDWPEDSIKQCADLTLMQLVASNIQYPIEARQQGIEGTVVIGVVVEPDSTLGEISILKDIGSGCGAEAKRILIEFGKAGLRWKPGINKGKAVRTRTAIPLKFKLQEAPPYLINARGDSVYTIIDSLPQFKGGEDSLFSFVINKLQYPGSYKDSCLCGIIEMAMLVYPDGKVLIENQLDYSDLGLDFQFEAIPTGQPNRRSMDSRHPQRNPQFAQPTPSGSCLNRPIQPVKIRMRPSTMRCCWPMKRQNWQQMSSMRKHWQNGTKQLNWPPAIQSCFIIAEIPILHWTGGMKPVRTILKSSRSWE